VTGAEAVLETETVGVDELAIFAETFDVLDVFAGDATGFVGALTGFLPTKLSSFEILWLRFRNRIIRTITSTVRNIIILVMNMF
jgi:hypothetical protein